MSPLDLSALPDISAVCALEHEIAQKVKAILHVDIASRPRAEALAAISKALDESPRPPTMPSPTEADLSSPMFEAIWQVIKTWDVNVPGYYVGYCGANGSHVKLILDAVSMVTEPAE